MSPFSGWSTMRPGPGIAESRVTMLAADGEGVWVASAGEQTIQRLAR